MIDKTCRLELHVFSAFPVLQVFAEKGKAGAGGRGREGECVRESGWDGWHGWHGCGMLVPCSFILPLRAWVAVEGRARMSTALLVVHDVNLNRSAQLCRDSRLLDIVICSRWSCAFLLRQSSFGPRESWSRRLMKRIWKRKQLLYLRQAGTDFYFGYEVNCGSQEDDLVHSDLPRRSQAASWYWHPTSTVSSIKPRRWDIFLPEILHTMRRMMNYSTVPDSPKEKNRKASHRKQVLFRLSKFWWAFLAFQPLNTVRLHVFHMSSNTEHAQSLAASKAMSEYYCTNMIHTKTLGKGWCQVTISTLAYKHSQGPPAQH